MPSLVRGCLRRPLHPASKPQGLTPPVASLPLEQSHAGGPGGMRLRRQDHFFLAIKANALDLAIFLSGDYTNLKEVSDVNAVLIMRGVQRSGAFWLAR